MRSPAQERRRRESRALATSASLAALLAAFMGLHISLPRLDDGRGFWGALAPSLRNDPVADLYGFGEPVWVELRRSVRAGDRYAVVAEGDGQHEIRNYAAYSLLPAVQVRDPEDANVVIYYDVASPPDGCVPVREGVCVVRSSG